MIDFFSLIRLLIFLTLCTLSMLCFRDAFQRIFGLNPKPRRILFSLLLGLIFFALASYIMALKTVEHLMDPHLISKSLKKQGNDYALCLITLIIFAVI